MENQQKKRFEILMCRLNWCHDGVSTCSKGDINGDTNGDTN